MKEIKKTYNLYDFVEDNKWVKRDCTCDCTKVIENLKNECLLAKGEIISVEDLQETFARLKDGEKAIVTLTKDLTVENDTHMEIPVGADVTLDFSGKHIEYKPDGILFRVNGNLTIKGNGTFKGDGYVASVNEGGKIIVEDGKYENDVTCFQSNGGQLFIEGGEYRCTSTTHGAKYMLNLIDDEKDKGHIEVTGGKFHNYNPSKSESENPAMDFVAEGYKVVELVDGSDTIYEVVKD